MSFRYALRLVSPRKFQELVKSDGEFARARGIPAYWCRDTFSRWHAYWPRPDRPGRLRIILTTERQPFEAYWEQTDA